MLFPGRMETVPLLLLNNLFSGMCSLGCTKEREKEETGRRGGGREKRDVWREAKRDGPRRGPGPGGPAGGARRQPLGCSCGPMRAGAERRAEPGRRWAGSDGDGVWVLCFHCNYN